MPEIILDIAEVKKRSLVGVLALTSRTLIIQIISFIATFALTVFLDPSIYGIFFLVSSVVNFLAYFSDIGLAAALIQKKGNISRDDLVTTFSIQQVMVVTLLLILFVLTPQIKMFYHISSVGIYLMWAMGISLFLSSLKTVPSVILEREIQFNKLIIPQIAETLVFNITAVYLAWRGWGINTFTVAVLLRGIVGLIAMYIVSPWKPGFGINKTSLSHLLKFGLPYQANTFMAVIKDDGMTILLGKIIGTTGLGYIGWASRWANMPLRIFMDNVTKVAFPAFSRMQHDPVHLKRAIEQSIKYLTLIVFPIFVVMAILASPIVNLIPRYGKWSPAIIPLYLYLFNAAWASISTMMTNALNAIGKIKTTFKLMVMWTILTWALMPFMAIRWGYVGVSIAVGLIALSSLVVVILLKQIVNFSINNSLKTPFLASLTLGVILILLRTQATTFIAVTLILLGGGLSYVITIYALEGKKFIYDTISYFRPNHA